MAGNPTPSRELLAALYAALKETPSNDPLVSLGLARIIQTTSSLRHPAGAEDLATVEWERVKFQVDLGDRLGTEFHYGLYRELPEALALLNSLPAGGRLVDVGANFGFFAVLGAIRVGPDGRVAAIEPHPRARALLEQNVAANGLREVVHILPLAVAEQDGGVPFHFAAETAFSGLGDTGRAQIESVGKIEGRSLDSLAREHKWGAVDALKIDVEGFEYAVLAGAGELLARSPDLIVLLEYSPKNLGGGRAEKFAAALKGAAARGFTAWQADWATLELAPIGDLGGEAEAPENIFLLADRGRGRERLLTALRSVSTVVAEAASGRRGALADSMRLALTMRSLGDFQRAQAGALRVTADVQDALDRGNSAIASQKIAEKTIERLGDELAAERDRYERAQAEARSEYRKLEVVVQRQAEELDRLRAAGEAALARAREEYRSLEMKLQEADRELGTLRAAEKSLQAKARAEYEKLEAGLQRVEGELRESRADQEIALGRARAEYESLESMLRRVDGELQEERRRNAGKPGPARGQS